MKLINNVFEKQGVSGHALTRLAALPAFHHTAEAVERETAAPHLYQRTHHSTDHVAQESVGTDFETP